jgi:hypothetical protein
MKTLLALAAIALLAACAASQTITLLPRAANVPQAHGTLDRMTNTLVVDVEGRRYQGKMQMQTATTSRSLFGPSSTTISNQATALLTGDGGHMRCEFGFDYFMTSATGVCVDNRNIVYDMQVSQ